MYADVLLKPCRPLVETAFCSTWNADFLFMSCSAHRAMQGRAHAEVDRLQGLRSLFPLFRFPEIMDNGQKFIVNPEYTVEKFDSEIFLYAVSSTQGIYLNETAYLVWEMCADHRSVGEIISLLEQAYPQQGAAIREDVPAAVQSMVDSGVLIAGNE